MILEVDKYYHLYNRSNNGEIVFKSEENFPYFLKIFNAQLKCYVKIIAYCLMPTHFHFLIKVNSNDGMLIQKRIGVLLSSYTKAINKRYHRTGALFQPHTKAKEITDEHYLLTLISYIHQNPIRSNIAVTLNEWEYSSYHGIFSGVEGSLVHQELYQQYFCTREQFNKYSEEMVPTVLKKFWI
jgi:REP element-mobilizing transposase RayT